ncbi:MAG: SigE family RNA polymerase sigma factor [Acidothermaceae bacterium]
MKREDEADFEAFVATSGHRLLRTAYLLVGDLHSAEDVLQTALERTARRWTRISGIPEAYARTVLANLATDRWRRRSARPAEVFIDPPEHSSTDFAADLVIRDALIRALSQLTRRQRAVLVLRFFDDLTEAETATALGISVGTVKSSTSRALDRLRTLAALHDLTNTPTTTTPTTMPTSREHLR